MYIVICTVSQSFDPSLYLSSKFLALILILMLISISTYYSNISASFSQGVAVVDTAQHLAQPFRVALLALVLAVDVSRSMLVSSLRTRLSLCCLSPPRIPVRRSRVRAASALCLSLGVLALGHQIVAVGARRVEFLALAVVVAIVAPLPCSAPLRSM